MTDKPDCSSRESDEGRTASGSLAVWLMAACLLLPVGYVLSSGPAVWLFHHGYLQSVPVIYWPLIQVEGSSTPFGTALQWYWSFF